MFANPLWSLAIIVALACVYIFVIRPRLKAAWSQTYLHIDSFWARQWARVVAFRTPIVGALGPILTALPDLLVLIPTMDLSFLPSPWPAWANGFSAAAVILMKALETKPDGQVA